MGPSSLLIAVIVVRHHRHQDSTVFKWNPLRELIAIREIWCCERAAILSPREYRELIVAQICVSSRRCSLCVGCLISRDFFFPLVDIFFSVCVRVEFTAVAVRFFSLFFGVVLPLARDIFFSFIRAHFFLCVCGRSAEAV